MKNVKLVEVCTIYNGGTPDTKKSEYWSGQHAWVTPAEMGKLKSPYLDATKRSLTDAGLASSSAQALPVHSVILSSRAPIGHLVINSVPMATNQGCKGLVPNESLNYKYLYYFLYSNKEYLNSLGSGTTFVEISGTTLKSVEIPLPSLAEQKAIVEKLDAAFAEIDKLEENLESKRRYTDELLNSILGAAFKAIGEVVAESHQGIFMSEVKLKSVCTTFADGDWIESKDQDDSGIRLVQTGNIGEGVFKDRIEKARWISEETFVRLRCTEIIEGDVLVSRLPDPVGRAALIPKLDHKAITAVDCSILRFNVDLMIPKFFIYYSQSSEYAYKIRPLISGATRQRISRENLGLLTVPLPPLSVQKYIVEKLDAAFAEIDEFRIQIKKAQASLVALRQSILSSAFKEVSDVA